MIVKVTESRWTQPDGKMGFSYHVYYSTDLFDWYKEKKGQLRYSSCRNRYFAFDQNLPLTVVRFMNEDCRSVDIKYDYHPAFGNLKRISYT